METGLLTNESAVRRLQLNTTHRELVAEDVQRIRAGRAADGDQWQPTDTLDNREGTTTGEEGAIFYMKLENHYDTPPATA
ncbi:hypothetical protein PC128_g23506 [Phytophthora cactorum]|nr:hypothetical protein PC128_g23506 [Phytophthora cactorum]